MKLGPNAQAALDQVVEHFRSGDLSPIVKIARLHRNGEPIPSDKWSLSNRILAFVQTGSYDCRGYRQWQQVGRYVKRGSKAAFIFGPILVSHREPDRPENCCRCSLRGLSRCNCRGLSRCNCRGLSQTAHPPTSTACRKTIASPLRIWYHGSTESE